MRYLMTTGQNGRQPDEALFADMGAFIEEMTAAGILIATGGLEPGGVRMTSHRDEITVTDGPFVEAKEEIRPRPRPHGRRPVPRHRPHPAVLRARRVPVRARHRTRGDAAPAAGAGVTRALSTG